jgi:hypothetical protein
MLKAATGFYPLKIAQFSAYFQIEKRQPPNDGCRFLYLQANIFIKGL